MKTAMQEMILNIESIESKTTDQEQIYMLTALKIAALVLFAKEKNQIVNAFEVGYKSCDMDDAFEINRKLASGEKYYTKTYNQNK